MFQGSLEALCLVLRACSGANWPKVINVCVCYGKVKELCLLPLLALFVLHMSCLCFEFCDYWPHMHKSHWLPCVCSVCNRMSCLPEELLCTCMKACNDLVFGVDPAVDE